MELSPFLPEKDVIVNMAMLSCIVGREQAALTLRAVQALNQQPSVALPRYEYKLDASPSAGALVPVRKLSTESGPTTAQLLIMFREQEQRSREQAEANARLEAELKKHATEAADLRAELEKSKQKTAQLERTLHGEEFDAGSSNDQMQIQMQQSSRSAAAARYPGHPYSSFHHPAVVEELRATQTAVVTLQAATQDNTDRIAATQDQVKQAVKRGEGRCVVQ